VRVPDEVAVLGVDNDRLLCDLADPPLSSVIPDTHRTGYEAAALLDRMMAGEKVPSDALLVPPLGVATRQSTDVLATNDPDLSAAVQFLREHAFEGIAVKDLLNEVPVSRRVLEARFKSLLGRSPHEELVRLRVERVKELLAETDLPLKAIALKVGVRHVEYVSVMFRRRHQRDPQRLPPPHPAFPRGGGLGAAGGFVGRTLLSATGRRPVFFVGRTLLSATGRRPVSKSMRLRGMADRSVRPTGRHGSQARHREHAAAPHGGQECPPHIM